MLWNVVDIYYDLFLSNLAQPQSRPPDRAKDLVRTHLNNIFHCDWSAVFHVFYSIPGILIGSNDFWMSKSEIKK